MMKKYIILAASIACVCSLGVFLLSTSEATLEERKNPKVLAMTTSIEIPDEVSLAGESLKLDRYDLHERFDREINSFAYLHSTTLLLIKRANRIFPIIDPILKANGIPEDFRYLAAIESSLDPRAVSSAKASGLWQLMPATATQFGLEVTSEVDERYSIEKSTQAACKYLNSAYRKYGNWSSVAMSYNAGMGRISGELDKQQAEDSLDLWLVEETSRYYFRMLALKCIFENPYKYGYVISADQLYKPIQFNSVEVTQSIPDLASFAKDNGVTYAQLKDFNSWLRDRKLTITPKSQSSYTILIPNSESLYYKRGEKIKVYDKRWVTE
ncbi:lytic transglycosylase domain-containing protein [Dysgonomonas sp. HDW5A]|nr:lytic transglycosylase domain-containing protein [Dysgonomonas sp. HDW5A]QIK58445.1 lytic transglycosylase domain-containing protein [Dysgonomonas sp. HDW5A]